MKIILVLLLIALASSTKDIIEDKASDKEDLNEPILEFPVAQIVDTAVKVGQFVWKHKETIFKVVNVGMKTVDFLIKAHRRHQERQRQKNNLRKKK